MSVHITFVGVRRGGQPTEPRDRFEQVETVSGVTAGSGLVSVTAKVEGIAAGEWDVTATPTVDGPALPAASAVALPVRTHAVHTRLAPLVHGFGVHPAVWPVLVLLGVVLAVSLQAVVAAHRGLNVTVTTVAALAGSLVGYFAAKFWYMALHRQSLRQFVGAGTCIQGFLVGAFGTAILVVVAAGSSIGAFADAVVPGVFFAMGMSRPGCLLGGCCSGRPTTSRWGLWSSDRRLGIRRVPTQLMEGAATLLIGAGALAAVLVARPAPAGLVFVAAVSAYTVIRQLLLPFRAEPRKTAGGRLLTLLAAVVVLASAVGILVAG